MGLPFGTSHSVCCKLLNFERSAEKQDAFCWFRPLDKVGVSRYTEQIYVGDAKEKISRCLQKKTIK